MCEFSKEDEQTGNLIAIEECKHKFCKDCLSNYITFKTSDAACLYHTVTLMTKEGESILKVEVLNTYGVACPALGCSHVLLINELKPIASAHALDQFFRFSKVHQENLQDQKENKGEKDIPMKCPKCGHNGVKKIKRGRLQCTKCYCPFCPKCGQKHASSMTCKEFQEQNPLLSIKGIIKCPKCQSYTTKEDGCQFLTCRCHQSFCNLCGCPLNQSKHYSHFLGAPFGDKCLGSRDGV